MLKQKLYIDSNTMKILIRKYGDKSFFVSDIRRDKNGTYIYTLNFDGDVKKDEEDYLKNIYIKYDHNDKDYYGQVIEI